MDIFFVLSGFLITSVLLDLRGREGCFRTFYSRRFRRILPPYLAFLSLVYIVSAALGDHTLYRLRTVVKNGLFLQSFLSTSDVIHRIASGVTWRLAHSALSPAGHGLAGPVSAATFVLWSLSIEEFFYLLWAPGALWLRRNSLIAVGVAVCAAAFLFRWMAFIGSSFYFSIYHRCDALIFGSFVALLVTSGLPRKTINAALLATAGVGLVTLAAVIAPMGNVVGMEIRADHVFAVFGIPAISLIAASAVGLCVAHSGAANVFLGFLRLPPLRFMGTISYTLYLLHGFVYLLILQFLAPTWYVAIIALFGAVALSWLSWIYLERPILEGGHSAKRRVNSAAGFERPALRVSDAVMGTGVPGPADSES